MNVVLLTPALTDGDAVSNDVLGMAETLRADGHRVTLSVKYLGGDFPIVPVNRVSRLLENPDDLLIYHHSIGCEEAVRAFEKARTRRIVKYHNVTPAEYFKGINAEVVRGCLEGARQVERLISPDVAIWADSAFNGRDMQLRRADHPFEVLPPFNQVHELLEASPDLTCVGLYDDWLTNVLVVGRVVPNKNVILAVEAFACYLDKFNSNARLIIVGDLAQNTYCEAVLTRIKDLRIGDRIVITGKVSSEQLKAFYLTSQMLLTTSKHEGFCLPLVEAMGLRVPAVGVRNGAMPETARDFGYFADETPEAIATAMHQAESDSTEREQRLRHGWDRYQTEFTNDVIATRFRELLATALGEKETGAGIPKSVSRPLTGSAR
jgi:glycosyltransferase involved in cell wall biosynthesis